MTWRAPLASAALGASVVLAGCASGAPRVEQLGEDAWMVTVENEADRGGQAGARERAQAQAQALCTSQQRVAVVTHLSSGISALLEGGVTELNFRCVAPDDPLVQLPPG